MITMQERDDGIANIMRTTGNKHQVAMLEFDYLHAPLTTNGQQLQEIGYDIKPYVEAWLDEEVHMNLLNVVDGLTILSTYIHNTEHLSDRELYQYILTNVLSESIRDLPLEARENVIEHIDVKNDQGLPKLYSRAIIPGHIDLLRNRWDV